MQNLSLSLKITADGSPTLYSDHFKQYYHSIFGAKAESDRVYIELGLQYALEQFKEVKIFEMGFGTGFNAVLSAQEALKQKRKVSYVGIEPFPLPKEAYDHLSADQVALQQLEWNTEHELNPYFTFKKVNSRLEEYKPKEKFNLVYYDAFPPSSQPELWTADSFQLIKNLMEHHGILTTFCTKGYVKRTIKSLGFIIEKHAGPPRKREVLRAISIATV